MKKISTTQFYLTLVFAICMLVSNILTAKTVQITENIVFTSALIVFPITYILSDVFSEVYGYKWSRTTCYIGFLTQLFAVLCFRAAIMLPYPFYWENQGAMELILGSTFRICIASLVAYFLGDLANDVVFQKMKEKDKEKRFYLRAILSSYVGNLLDSTVFLILAFFGDMPMSDIVIMIFTEASVKSIYETVMLPVTGIVVNKVKNVENIL